METVFRVFQRGHHYASNHENGIVEYLHDRQHRNDHPTVVDIEGHLRGRISELGFIYQGQLRNHPIIYSDSQMI